MTAAACIRTKHALSGALLRFFLTAAEDVPIQDIAALPEFGAYASGPLASLLLSSPRSLARMTRRLLESTGASHSPLFPEADFSSLPARLVLLSGKQLRELAVYAGLTLHCRAVAAIVERGDVRVLRVAFGDTAHQFAVLRAPFFLRDPDRLARALGDADALRLRPEQARIEDLVSRVNLTGLACLAACAQALPPVPAMLFERKLAALSTRDMGIVPPAPVIGDDGKYSLHALLNKLLRKELEQKWNPSCS